MTDEQAGGKHRADVVARTDGHPAASSVYWARITQVRTWKDALAEGLLELLSFGLPLPTGEPKFRVLVARRGAHGYIGVREAYNLRTARAALAEVEQLLSSSTPEEARALLKLDF